MVDHPPLDPRAERSRQAILQAAAAIIEEEGYAAVSHQRVAERAGVGRATVYRHWGQLDDLLFDAVSSLRAPIFRSGSGTVREWLERELAHAGELFASPTVQHLIAILIDRGGGDTGFDAVRTELGRQADEQLAARLHEAVDTGELATSPDPTDLAARLLGPLLFRALLQSRPIDDNFVAEVVDRGLAADGVAQQHPPEAATPRRNRTRKRTAAATPAPRASPRATR